MPSGGAGKSMFFCGLLGVTLAPFALILGLAPHEAQLPGIIFAANLTGGGHVASTLYLFGDPGFRPLVRRGWLRFVVAPLALGAGFIMIGQLAPTIWPGLFLAFFSWQVFHYQRQNYGIVSFAAKASGTRLPAQLSAALSATVPVAILGVMASRTTDLPALGDPGVLRLVGAALYAVAIAWIIVIVWRDPAARRSPLVVAATGCATLFFLPALLSGSVLVVFWSYAIAHGAQYLLFMCVLAWTAPRRAISASGLALAILGGLFFFAGLRTSFVQHFYLGITCGHFLIDAKVWRLREMPQRALIGGRFGFALAAPGARGSIASGEIGAEGQLPLAARLGAGPG